MSLVNVQRVLASFGEKVGLPGAELSEEGYFTLSVDEFVVTLVAQEDDDAVTFHVWIGEVESSRRPQVALALADANYLLAGSHGATLGMNRNSGDVALAARTSASTLDLMRFELLVEKLVNLAEHWRNQVKETAKGDEPPEDSNPMRKFGIQV